VKAEITLDRRHQGKDPESPPDGKWLDPIGEMPEEPTPVDDPKKDK
jgi:hypothetical protein